MSVPDCIERFDFLSDIRHLREQIFFRVPRLVAV